MTSQDDIDAMADDEAVFQRVAERVARGVPEQKELTTAETVPFIRAAIRWRLAAMNLWDEKQRGDRDAMQTYADPKYNQRE